MFAVLDIPDYLILTLMFLLFTSTSAYAVSRPRTRVRLNRLERKLDAILKHLNIDAQQFDELSAAARRLADEGKKIEAIKAHREQTGVGLRQAKEEVEAYLEGKATP